VSQPRP